MYDVRRTKGRWTMYEGCTKGIEEKYTKLGEIICINQKFFVFLQKILEVQ